MKNKWFLSVVLVSSFCLPGISQQSSSADKIKSFIAEKQPEWESLYLDLHQHPELSFHEMRTSGIMAANLEKLGFEVTRHFGGNSVVGVMHNGKGPVILCRTDMDALPVIEKTNLPYASTVRAQTDDGKETGVMHACGHDTHMSIWTGTATTLSHFKKAWKGTLIMIAQQAEEKSGGANAMIDAGLFKKFPVPDYALALHVSPEIEAGKVGYTPGPAFAGVNSVDIHVYGVGGHGAYPHKTIDPVVLASRIVVALQTIVSRELSPLDPAVVTVGSIHGGTTHNIIPDEVDLQLTIRFYKDEVFDHIIHSIHQITRGIAISAGLPEEKFPEVIVQKEFTPPLYNDPDLTGKVTGFMKKVIGKDNVMQVDPTMAGEDFGKYGRTEEHVPVFMYFLGSVGHDKMQDHLQNGTPLPPLHSPEFYPDYKKTIQTGVLLMSTSVIDLFNRE